MPFDISPGVSIREYSISYVFHPGTADWFEHVILPKVGISLTEEQVLAIRKSMDAWNEEDMKFRENLGKTDGV